MSVIKNNCTQQFFQEHHLTMTHNPPGNQLVGPVPLKMLTANVGSHVQWANSATSDLQFTQMPIIKAICASGGPTFLAGVAQVRPHTLPECHSDPLLLPNLLLFSAPCLTQSCFATYHTLRLPRLLVAQVLEVMYIMLIILTALEYLSCLPLVRGQHIKEQFIQAMQLP